jgi:hypothetical protein
MGVEVDWRDVKKLLPASATLGAFTGALMQFIADLGDEHVAFLAPTGGLFPSKQVLCKPVYDEMQDFHSKTLLCTIPMAWDKPEADKWFEDLVDTVDRCGYEGAPLHLKLKAYHADVASGVREKSRLKQSHLTELLMPRDWYLKSIDPEGKRPLAEVKTKIEKRALQYYALVRQEKTMGEYGLLDALDLYESFNLVHRQASWGQPGKDGKPDEGFPWGCLCLRCQKWTLCEHTAIVESLFRADIEVPDNLVAETPSLRKKCNKLRGTAGPRRARILKEIAKEKKKSTSKIGFVDEPVPPQPDPPQLAPVPSESARDVSPPPEERFNVPSPNLPSSEDEANPKPPASSQEPPRQERTPLPPRSATQPIPESSDKEV